MLLTYWPATLLLIVLMITPDLILLGFHVCLMHNKLTAIRRQKLRKNNFSVTAIAYLEVTGLNTISMPRFSQKSVKCFIFVPLPFFSIKVPNLLIDLFGIAVLLFWQI